MSIIERVVDILKIFEIKQFYDRFKGGPNMTELINADVTHKTFGDGKIINLKTGYVTILFTVGKKEFQFPDAFKGILILKNSTHMKKVNDLIKENEKSKTKDTIEEKVEKVNPFAKIAIGRTAKPISMNHTDLYGLEHMKIGEIARTVLRGRLENGHVDADEIELMQTKHYSRETFHIQYPLLLKTNNPSGDKPVRYYAKPLKIWGNFYYLCSEWYEVPANNDRPFLMKWLILHK